MNNSIICEFTKSASQHFTKKVKGDLLLAEKPSSLETVHGPEFKRTPVFPRLCSRLHEDYRHHVKLLDATMDQGQRVLERFFKVHFW